MSDRQLLDLRSHLAQDPRCEYVPKSLPVHISVGSLRRSCTEASMGRVFDKTTQAG